jgi:hypothetical protein
VIKKRLPVYIEPGQLDAMRQIEKRTGASLAAQIRLAIDAYLEGQLVLTKTELRKILKG